MTIKMKTKLPFESVDIDMRERAHRKMRKNEKRFE